MKIYILTLFPEEMRHYFLKGLMGRGYERGLFDIQFIDLRVFSVNRYRQVDDYPFGGHQGMILKPDVIYRAVTSIDHYESYRLLYTCPKGSLFNQARAASLYWEEGFVIICGYYEGIDERVFDALNIERVSMGDFVLSSGELPALTIAETVIRLIPGVVGDPQCIQDDSFVSGLLEYPQYTTPRRFLDRFEVPDVLRSGHHGRIAHWRRRESLKETLFFRPDLLADTVLTLQDQHLLADILKEEIYDGPVNSTN